MLKNVLLCSVTILIYDGHVEFKNSVSLSNEFGVLSV